MQRKQKKKGIISIIFCGTNPHSKDILKPSIELTPDHLIHHSHF